MPDLNHLLSSLGRREVRRDRGALELLDALATTLDDSRRFSFGMPVPPLWHWIFFRPEAAQADLREDGHAIASALLPPIPLPRRMWAGSRLHIVRPLRAGHLLSRETTIEKIVEKKGTEGPLLFITLRYLIADENGEAIVEEQDLVYRDAPAGGTKASHGGEATVIVTAEPADWRDQVDPSTTLLFRYSALTFNAHRIHYDRRYAEAVEGYPGLVVHGPLIATLLVRSAARAWPAQAISRIDYRGQRPMFDTGPVFLAGSRTGPSSAKLWAHDVLNRTCATLLVEFEASDASQRERAAP